MYVNEDVSETVFPSIFNDKSSSFQNDYKLVRAIFLWNEVFSICFYLISAVEGGRREVRRQTEGENGRGSGIVFNTV